MPALSPLTSKPLIRLPLRFDAAAVQKELESVDARLWWHIAPPAPRRSRKESKTESPLRRSPLDAKTVPKLLPLITIEGQDALGPANAGQVAARPVLETLPYLRNVLAALGGGIGRALVVKRCADVAAETASDRDPPWLRVPLASQAHVHWLERVLVVAAIDAAGGPTLSIADAPPQPLREGELWAFDPGRPHRIMSPGAAPSTWLVVSVRPEQQFQQWLGDTTATEPQTIAPSGDGESVGLEPFCFRVPEPDQMDALVATIEADAAPLYDGAEHERLRTGLQWLREQWREVFEAVGHDIDRLQPYAGVIVHCGARLPFDLAKRLPPQSAGARAYAMLATIFDTDRRAVVPHPRFRRANLANAGARRNSNRERKQRAPNE